MGTTRREWLLGAAALAIGGTVWGTRTFGAASVAVEWMWSGAVDPDGATVVAKLSASATSCRLKVSTTSDLLTAPVFSPAVAPDADNYVKLPITGLSPDTAYHYGVEIDGSVDPLRGQFSTHPDGAVESFRIAFGSCSASASNHRVYDAIRGAAPLFLAHLGDFHYADIATNDTAAFRTAIEGQFAQARRAQLHRELPTAYIYDDHDSAGNDCDSTATAMPACATAYRQTVPHYPTTADGNPAYQSFRIGRVKFIVTDLRHARTPNSATDDASKTMLGATQKAWFKAELDDARDSAGILVVWLNSQVWRVDPPFTGIDTAANGQDHWGAFSTERAELANYIKDNNVPQMMILGGDAHFVAFDDGTHADYATGGGAPIPEFHASAFDEGGNSRGTNWMSGVSEGGGRYGLVDFEDDGTRMAVSVRAYQVDGTTGAETLVRSFVFYAASWGDRMARPRN